MGNVSENGVHDAVRPDGITKGRDESGSPVGGAGTNGESSHRCRGGDRQGLESSKNQPRRAKRTTALESEGGGLAAAALRAVAKPTIEDRKAESHWPELLRLLNATKDINGEACEPGGLSVNVRAGRLSWSLRSPAYNVRISGWADSLCSVFDAIEATLASPDPVCVELKKHVSKKYQERNKQA